MVLVNKREKEILSMLADKDYCYYRNENYKYGLDLTQLAKDSKGLYNAIDSTPVIRLDPIENEWILEHILGQLIDYIYYGVE